MKIILLKRQEKTKKKTTKNEMEKNISILIRLTVYTKYHRSYIKFGYNVSR